MSIKHDLNDLSFKVIGCCYRVHSQLGPGLLESVYEVCLHHELTKVEINAKRQVAMPVVYDDLHLDAGYRADLIVESQMILEIKSVESIADVHKAQILTYMRLSNLSLGLLLNFNVTKMKHGINRFIY